MKRFIILFILAAFAWSIPACTNRNRQNMDNNNFSDDSLNDTMVSPPVDTTNNQTIDTSIKSKDTY